MRASLPMGYDPATTPRVLVCLPAPLLPLIVGRLYELTERRLWADDYEGGYNAISEVIAAMAQGTCLQTVEELLGGIAVRLDTYFGGAQYSSTTSVDGKVVFAPPVPPVPVVVALNTPYQTGIDIREEEKQQTIKLEAARVLLEEILTKVGQDDVDIQEILAGVKALGVLLL